MQPRPQPQVQPQAQAQPQPPVQAQARPQPHPQPQPRQAPVQSEDEKIIPVVEDEMLPSGMEAQGAEPEPVEAQPEQTESQQTQSGQVQQPQAHHEAEPEVVFSAKRFATELAGDYGPLNQRLDLDRELRAGRDFELPLGLGQRGAGLLERELRRGQLLRLALDGLDHGVQVHLL